MMTTMVIVKTIHLFLTPVYLFTTICFKSRHGQWTLKSEIPNGGAPMALLDQYHQEEEDERTSRLHVKISALDGYNVFVFAYGQMGTGKTHTMEGSSHDHGVYFRTFEDLYDLSNANTVSSSKFYFHVTIFELHNEQVHDFLLSSSGNLSRIHMGMEGSSVELVQEKLKIQLNFQKF